MKNKPSDYYLKNISRRWKIEVNKATDKVIIVSPYLTSKTAELIIDNSVDRQYEIYTVFSVQNFASGASSLKTLKRLSDRGCKLYHLPRLHAKMILIPGSFASIGSQNLTRNGTRNKEASIAIFNPKEVAKIERRLEKWLEQRQCITKRMIYNLEDRLLALKKKYNSLRKEANQLENEIWAEETKHIEEARIAREQEKARIEKEIIQRKEEFKWKEKVNSIRTKVKQLSEHKEIERSLAEEFIRKSAYWNHPKAGRFVLSPGHASRIIGNKKNWRIEFGSNSFLVGHAICRCQQTLLEFLRNFEYTKIKPSDNQKIELRQKLELNVLGAVANSKGYEYYYPSDDNYMVFGTQAINFKEFVNFFLKKVELDNFLYSD
ncbi:phospholipase D-like domain-containing protein [Rivularia sp. UHCC 0363]|uniref:phospholipase D-like domain-containing protein n=1 Tax=Rivularia sp. UHCC 0363 TaxID=3110244 RepID=UPI002B2153FA|nr:phospholipase D-like domain-containing protein [Rivularia sp. UHCC 0363]MEA5596650.1 phospholipase D-like domain-containing protein [Rivularia sp. UHCC 0363]